jgi:hypothetical protein
MAAYSQFLGRRVTVRYRVGDILLSATGTFSADSGRSIFLEQSFEQSGTRKYFRWEIPYPYIYRIETMPDGEAGPTQDEQHGTQNLPKQAPGVEAPGRAAAAAAGESPKHPTSLVSFLKQRTSNEPA